MNQKVSKEAFVKFKREDVVYASQLLIAVSSMLDAASDQYACTGSLSVGSIIYAGSVVDAVIERLSLAELEIAEGLLPF